MKAGQVYTEIKNISRQKLELAHESVEKIVMRQENSEILVGHACFIIAGDIVYGMAHSEPRPETSINEIVNGSDLDIIVVTENLSGGILNDLDSSMYQEKYYLIKNPSYREEIDYLIKDIQKVQEQLKFDNFKYMVASKILYEGKFLYGSREIFRRIKKMLSEREIPEKLLALEKEAIISRKNAESYLLGSTDTLSEEEFMKLFYTAQEKEEIF
jgi:vacuolar-type H+-ATPase subunit F/Vma7